MKNGRSVSKRNFLGGFLGGFMGILTFGYLHPAFLPLGVLLGVVVGWWYEDILDTIVKSFQKGVRTGSACYGFFSQATVSSIPALRNFYSCFRLNKVGRIFVVLFASVGTVFIWLLYRPIAFINWLRAHPMNRAYLVRVAAFLIFLAIGAACISQMGIWFLPEAIRRGVDWQGARVPFQPDWVEYLLSCFLVFCFFVIVPALLYSVDFLTEEEDLTDMKIFYQTVEYYNKRGALAFFLQELFGLVQCQINFITWLIAGALYFTGTGILIFSFVVVPLSSFIYSIKGIYQIVTRSGHWLCLGVTMTATIVLAWLFAPYFDNRYILWNVAFITGVASGAITELIRRSLVWFFTETDRGVVYAMAKKEVYLKERFVPKGQLILQGWHRLGFDERLISCTNL